MCLNPHVPNTCHSPALRLLLLWQLSHHARTSSSIIALATTQIAFLSETVQPQRHKLVILPQTHTYISVYYLASVVTIDQILSEFPWLISQWLQWATLNLFYLF